MNFNKLLDNVFLASILLVYNLWIMGFFRPEGWLEWTLVLAWILFVDSYAFKTFGK